MKMTCTLIALLLTVASFTVRLPHNKGRMLYQELAEQLEQQIEQFGSLSTTDEKIDDAEISMNGDIQLRSGGNTHSFNIYQLYKTHDYVYGLQISGTTIRFRLSGKRSISLVFDEATKVKAVHQSLLSLMMAGKDMYSPDLSLDINETVDSINLMLHRLSAYNAKIRINITGTVIITNSNMQFFDFNLSQLSSSVYSQGFEVNGIEMVPCTYSKVVANNWINFNSADGKMAYIKFNEVSDEELNTLHQLFIHLRTSMMNIMNV